MAPVHPPLIRPAEGAHDRALCDNARPPGWRNPRPRDPYHLLVIGAGPAGLVAARGAAALGAKVALIESHLLGGDCLNYGCVPSKSLIRTARLYAEMRNAPNYGARMPQDIQVDFTMAMERMRRIRTRISRVDSASRLTGEGIDVFFGTARFTGGDAVEVEGTRLRFRKALIATGSRSVLPTIPGLADAGYLTNETVFDLTVLPQSLLVIGGGPLGCELAQAFGTLRVAHGNHPRRAPVPAQGRTRRGADGLRGAGARRRRDPPQHHRHQRARRRWQKTRRNGQRWERRDDRGRADIDRHRTRAGGQRPGPRSRRRRLRCPTWNPG